MRHLSQVYCEYCKEKISEYNPAYALPTNQIICKRTVEEFEKNSKFIVCPLSNKKIKKSCLRKVFLS